MQPIYNILPHDYDKYMPPIIKGRPLTLKVTFWILSITEINEMSQDFTVDLYLRMIWHDYRLLFPVCELRPFIIMDSDQLEDVWRPDLFFKQAKKSSRHDIARLNAALKVNRADQSIFYSERLTITNFCAFDFRFFPLDRQRCSLPVESFNFYAKYVNLTFQPPGIYFNNFKFKIPQYTLSHVEARDCSYYYHYQGSYINHTCVEASFIFDRQFSYYFVQMYLPSILIVLVSFLSFWIPVENVPGRVMLGVTSLLTLATQFTTAQRSLPPVSYLKAMDVWMFFCIVVVFFAMGEFTLAYNLKDLRLGVSRRVEPALVRPRKVATVTEPAGEEVNAAKPRLAFGGTPGSEHQPHQAEDLSSRFLKWLNRGNSSVIDNLSKIIFPITFAVFNIIYWLYYTRTQK